MQGTGRIYRFFLQDILCNVEICLFLNYDVRALRCISKIFKIDMEQYLALVSRYYAGNKILENDCVLNLMIGEDFIGDFCKSFECKGYFDNGIMLLNLAKMREENMAERFYTSAMSGKDSPNGELLYSIEGIFNLGLKGKVKFCVF